MDQRPPPIVARPAVHKMITTCEKVSLPAGSQEQESCYLLTEETINNNNNNNDLLFNLFAA